MGNTGVLVKLFFLHNILEKGLSIKRESFLRKKCCKILPVNARIVLFYDG